MTRIRKAKKIVDGIPENVKMGEEKEENWRSIALSGKIKVSNNDVWGCGYALTCAKSVRL